MSDNHFSKVPAKKMHHTLGSLDAGANSNEILDGPDMHIFRQSKEQQAQASILSQLGDIFGISHEVKDKIQMLTSSFVVKS